MSTVTLTLTEAVDVLEEAKRVTALGQPVQSWDVMNKAFAVVWKSEMRNETLATLLYGIPFSSTMLIIAAGRKGRGD